MASVIGLQRILSETAENLNFTRVSLSKKLTPTYSLDSNTV